MILLLLLLLSLPSLVFGNCACEELWKEIALERKDDEKNFGCRSCPKPAISSSAACPVSGFECRDEWQITSNVLTASDSCRCSEAKCGGKARLASDRNIINKMRCSGNKWWTAADVEAEPVVCAKPCNSKVCAVKYTKVLPEFEQLKTLEAGKENACAVGYCEDGYTPTLINENGIAGDGLEGGTRLTCTGDGLWKTDEKLLKYVMCRKNPAGCTPYPFNKGICDAVPGFEDCSMPTIETSFGFEKVACTAPDRPFYYNAAEGFDPASIICDPKSPNPTWKYNVGGFPTDPDPKYTHIGCAVKTPGGK